MTELAVWLDRLDSIREVVYGHAGESEQIRRMPGPVVDAIVANRLFRLWIPREFDGEELDLAPSLAVFEAASRMDGAFGWTVTIGVGGGLFAPLLPLESARAIYRPVDAVIAGSGSPSGTLEPATGGYFATGRWKYASGIHHATTVTASCRLMDGDKPALDPAGQPIFRAIAVPRERVRIHETWDTLGLRGTGSHDIEVSRLFVPAGNTFDVLGQPGFPGPLYAFPFASIAEASFAAVALGIGQHFFDLFGELAAGKTTRQGTSLGEVPVVRIRMAEGAIALDAARRAFYHAVEVAWSYTLAGKAVPQANQEAVRHASVFASQTAVEVSDRLYAVAGMSVLGMSSEIGQAWRDVHTVSQHVLLSPVGYR